MAIVEVKVPQLSESVAEATLLQWKKKPGEAVAMDEILIEIETDKVVLEVPAPAAGVMAEIVKNDGDSCVSDEVIAKIDTEGRRRPGAMQITQRAAGEPAPRRHAAASRAAVAAPAAAKSGVAMPAAAKLMADNDLAGRLGARHRQGRPRHQGRRAGALEARRGAGGAVAGAPSRRRAAAPRRRRAAAAAGAGAGRR